ncbi:MAG: PQQ-binding-like beta-propeller repeat protein [Lentisphaeria bacterium]|nr:PQQ-binding-like beta-propeller repeat protein [Lentisphaeria bacterium]NQZ70197.1 PQQ-binding-like beta-propeller repeat protein [Lentisphaeria bacterium]
MKTKILILLVLSLLNLNAADKADWATWAGPTADFKSTETKWKPKGLAKGAKILWRKNVGQGYSQAQIKGDRLLIQGNKNNTNTVYCLNPVSGKVLWTYKYPCKNPKQFSGSALSPVFFNGKVYVAGRDSQVICLNEKTGKEIWKKQLSKDLKVKIGMFGFVCNLKTIGKDKLLLNTGNTGVLLDAKSGKIIWGGAGKTFYGTATTYTRGGKDYYVKWGANKVHAMSVKTGKEVWSYPWKTQHDLNSAEPLVIGTKVFISSGYNHGCALLETKGNKVKLLWENKNMRSHFAMPVLVDGFLYGVDGQANSNASFVCLDLKTGKKVWSQKIGFGGFMLAGDHFVFCGEKGKLIIFERNSKKYVEISSAQTALKKQCWGTPLLCRGLLYARDNDGAFICVDLRK